MLIVQISDIHCGPMFNQDTFRTAIKEINAMSPDAVVITGDLTEDGIQSQFKQAPKEVFAAYLLIPEEKLKRILKEE